MSWAGPSSVLAFTSHRIPCIPHRNVFLKSLLPWACLTPEGQKPRQYLVFPCLHATVSHYQLLQLHSFHLLVLQQTKHNTERFLTPPHMESKSSFSALVRTMANQLCKRHFTTFTFQLHDYP